MAEINKEKERHNRREDIVIAVLLTTIVWVLFINFAPDRSAEAHKESKPETGVAAELNTEMVQSQAEATIASDEQPQVASVQVWGDQVFSRSCNVAGPPNPDLVKMCFASAAIDADLWLNDREAEANPTRRHYTVTITQAPGQADEE